MSGAVTQKLRVRVRSDTSHHHATAASCSSTLFARLHPTVAQSLLQNALREWNEKGHPQQHQPQHDSWDVMSSHSRSKACSSGIEFLPLAVTFSSSHNKNNHDETIYVSYNGGSILMEEDHERTDNKDVNIIELPQSLVPGYIVQATTMTNNTVVATVQVLPWLVTASSLQVDPLATEDWELLETSSDFLESGGLLQQVSVVYPNEILQLYMSDTGCDIVRVRVMPSNFRTASCVGDNDDSSFSSSSSEEGAYQDYDDDTNESINNDQCCLRLVADTEVIIAPKPRRSHSKTPNDLDVSQPLRVYPTGDDWSAPMKDLDPVPSFQKTNVARLSLCAHPETLSKYVPGWKESSSADDLPTKDHHSMMAIVSNAAQQQNDSDDSATSTAVARIYTSKDIPIGHVALHQGVRYQIGVTPLYDKIRLKIISSEEKNAVPQQVLELLNKGTLQIALRPWIPNFEELPRVKPWLRPSQFLQSRLITSAFDNSDSTNVASVDVPANCRNLPCSSGCILYLPWTDKTSNSVNKPLYEVTFTWKNPRRENSGKEQPLLFVLAKDLPKVLRHTLEKQSLDVRHESHTQVECISNMPKDDEWLNLLPQTRHRECEGHLHPHTALPTLVSNSQHFQTTLITGEPGSGKTHNALLLAARLRLTRAVGTLYIDCKRLQSSFDIRMKDILNEFTKTFKRAEQIGSSVVILDDIDLLVPNNLDTGHQDAGSIQHQQTNPIAIDQAKLISDHLRNLFDELLFARPLNYEAVTEPSGIILTCRNDKSVAPCLLRPKESISCLPVPNLNDTERMSVLSKMLDDNLEKSLRDRYNLSPTLIYSTIRSFGKKTESFKPRDLSVITSRVDHLLHTTTLSGNQNTTPPVGLSINEEDVASAVLQILSSYTPISQQLVGAEVTQYTNWTEIGGLFQAKEQLTETILRPVKYKALYEKAPIKLPRGVLLFGYPGCGKSYLVPALAKECGLNLITCRGPELLDKYIGASEQKVRDLFMRAYSAAPSILFLDEFDSLAPKRGSDHTGVTDRVVNQLLTFLDGVEDNGGKMVYILGATSRPDRVDPALLRPGRLGMHIFIGRPHSDKEWHDLFQKIVLGRNVDSEVAQIVSQGKILTMLDNLTDQLRNFTAADMKAVMDTAHLDAVHSFLANCSKSTSHSEANADNVCVRLPNLVRGLQTTRPSISSDDQRMLSRIYSNFMKSSGSNDKKSHDDNLHSAGDHILKSTLR